MSIYVILVGFNYNLTILIFYTLLHLLELHPPISISSLHICWKLGIPLCTFHHTVGDCLDNVTFVVLILAGLHSWSVTCCSDDYCKGFQDIFNLSSYLWPFFRKICPLIFGMSGTSFPLNFCAL